MVNRELIRAKIVQLVYAYLSGGDKPLDVALRELETSLSKANDLYYYMLDLIVAVTKEARVRYEVGCQRALRERTERPSERFAENRFARQLEDNETLLKFAGTHKHDWREDVEYVRRLCDLIEQTDTYAEYVSSPESGYECDREVWRKLYKQIISDNDELDMLLEEKSLYWNDDKEIVDTVVVKTIKRFDEKTGTKQELLPEYKDPLDRKFALQLFCAAIENKDEYTAYMEAASINWELARMPFIDIVIMQIAIAEMFTFPDIPISVTINEYVELSKTYSTPKSATFINAMLDNIARTLISEGKILKQMN
ncbi:MAG: transcription antitermination factor NusB [Prevotella sp.]|nr:transcription antitermination factor NusB [Prevotella sp.]